ncbi:NADP-dependent isocitrate dehydrogenase [Deinococcus multiflagellatus]|uniref:NADP-dependent isocitrate dehydrogenase n=1 Tax=Deinococcus multiflagellatus TaxID=1656887 RepID=UPI001CCF1FFC|nr:NADP-dependent isocitrate dehydrogenase [Deinococcus multiflagellatus]MBZ9715101.1 NADP-dependent isocitrate dehydrogenase [Deinococcus multiflagellatus]
MTRRHPMMQATLDSHHSAPTDHTALVPVAVAHGDGIGPEIMDATLRVLSAAGARIQPVPIRVGEAVYKEGHTSGFTPDTWDTLRAAGVLLKAPITTPQGGGYKSLNVTLRKTLGLYANVRPCRAYAPFVPTLHPQTDVVIIRENEEDLYAGIEHRQTREVVQCLKLVTREGCERIVRYAFEYARAHGRKKVTALSKDNIMKLTDGLFHEVYREIGAEYPDIAQEHQIIDIGTARLATRPERYDVIVTLNLYGDIISDVAAEITGSVGLAGSANIGPSFALFEAIHGSAPDIAGQNLANPGGLLQAAVMMLGHLGQHEVAEQVQNAWLRTLEDGIHTPDIAGEHTKEKVGTREFADAVIARLGQVPAQLPAARRSPGQLALPAAPPSRRDVTKTLVGTDVFFEWAEADRDPQALAEKLQAHATGALRLNMITNRGVKVWPGGQQETRRADHWRCRFLAAEGQEVTHADVVALLSGLLDSGLDFIKTEHLYTFDGVPGFSMGQGQ